MLTTTTTSPVTQLVTFALTFATLADQGARREARSQRPDAQASAAYNRHRANAFRLAAEVIGRDVDHYAANPDALLATLDRWVWLRDGSFHPVTPVLQAEREAFQELYREAARCTQ